MKTKKTRRGVLLLLTFGTLLLAGSFAAPVAKPKAQPWRITAMNHISRVSMPISMAAPPALRLSRQPPLPGQKATFAELPEK